MKWYKIHNVIQMSLHVCDMENGYYSMNKFVITPKDDDKSLTVTVRVRKALLDEYDDLAVKTNQSRNELICMALQYALENTELHEA